MAIIAQHIQISNHCCTPKINMLYVNYTSMKNGKRKRHGGQEESMVCKNVTHVEPELGAQWQQDWRLQKLAEQSESVRYFGHYCSINGEF